VPSRFPLFTDEIIAGPLIKALVARGWDVERAVDVFGEKTDDEVLFAHTAEQGRIFVTADQPAEAIAIRWLREGRTFHGMIRCPQGITVAELLTRLRLRPTSHVLKAPAEPYDWAFAHLDR